MEVALAENRDRTAPMPPGGERLFENVKPVAAIPGPPVCCLAIDAEEDFDWDHPGYSTGYTTNCMRRIVDLVQITSAYRLRPAYLLTYPILNDPDLVRMIRHQHDRGLCDMGIQLHPWVTPPFESLGPQASYLGELDPHLEEQKLVNLIAAFRAAFGSDPVVFRAGRYGLSRATTGLLERYGIAVDTSLAPRTDFSREGGPDFSFYDCDPFWFGKRRPLLEIPLCRSLVGWGGPFAPGLYRHLATPRLKKVRLAAILSRLRCAERVTLSPEGNDVRAMRRLLRGRRQRGQFVFTLSFHSSSLAPGRNPYVRDRAGLHHFYDRFSAILDGMAKDGFTFSTLDQLPGLFNGG